MTVCLDSSAYIEMFRGNKAVADFIGACDEVIVPAAVVAELVEGFFATPDSADDQIRLNSFLALPNVGFRAADYEVAERFAILSHLLRRRGRPIPVNDIWIAATAFETGPRIVSYDRHFDEIDGLVRIAP